MNDKIYRACAYLRLSREDEDKRGGLDESNSIKSQRMMIENFVHGLSDVELVKRSVMTVIQEPIMKDLLFKK